MRSGQTGGFVGMSGHALPVDGGMYACVGGGPLWEGACVAGEEHGSWR
jgi:hypothetical protein